MNLKAINKDKDWVMVIPVVSTAHITMRDAEILDANHDRIGGMLVASTDPDFSSIWIFCVEEYGACEEQENRRAFPELSDGFHNLLKAVESAGFSHVRLDPDGDTVEGLETYFWA